MPSLKEIKNRVGSVQNTLKITSAMKLVASSKLHRAQQAIEAMRPYEKALLDILSHLLAVEGAAPRADESRAEGGGTAIVAFASNSSLCGAFNANAVRKALQQIEEAEGPVTVFSIGRKMADALKKAQSLMEAFAEGRYSRVVLVYNHFVSTARQEPVAETLLPLAAVAGQEASQMPPDVILEPSAQELIMALQPKSVKLRLYAALLDSVAAEHAARTVAMQMATDNGNDLLQELVLQYNKSRQQKITSEILDLAGGQQQ